jgi:hypothetical protein
MASFALVSKYGMSPLDWQNVMARLVEICAPAALAIYEQGSQSMGTSPYHSLALLHINLVSKDDL